MDTSALYALLVESDGKHLAARSAAQSLRSQDARLVTSSFVVLEAISLIQARLGVETVRVFYRDMLPLLQVLWVSEDLLHRAMAALLASSQRRISITDWSSFTLMREREIERAFTFDDDFSRQGFELVPKPSS